MTDRVHERIVQLPDGRRLLEGVSSVGIENGYSFSDVYSYPPNGFPKTQPSDRVSGQELVWAALSKQPG